jgi:hypothetical protein
VRVGDVTSVEVRALLAAVLLPKYPAVSDPPVRERRRRPNNSPGQIAKIIILLFKATRCRLLVLLL